MSAAPAAVPARMRRAGMILLALGALLLFALLVALVLYPEMAFAQGFGPPGGGGPKATPFGLGGAAAQPPSGITGFILAKQAEFYRALVGAVRAAKQDGHATFLLAGLSFA